MLFILSVLSMRPLYNILCLKHYFKINKDSLIMVHKAVCYFTLWNQQDQSRDTT